MNFSYFVFTIYDIQGLVRVYRCCSKYVSSASVVKFNFAARNCDSLDLAMTEIKFNAIDATFASVRHMAVASKDLSSWGMRRKVVREGEREEDPSLREVGERRRGETRRVPRSTYLYTPVVVSPHPPWWCSSSFSLCPFFCVSPPPLLPPSLIYLSFSLLAAHSCSYTRRASTHASGVRNTAAARAYKTRLCALGPAVCLTPRTCPGSVAILLRSPGNVGRSINGPGVNATRDPGRSTPI